jgi:hypothetical protein
MRIVKGRHWWWVALLAVLASGCSDDGGSEAATTTLANPTTTIEAASVAEYVAIIEDAKEELELSLAEARTCMVSCDEAGAVSVVVAGLEAETLALRLVNAGDASAASYVGAPPPELASLFLFTISAANELDGAVNAWTGASCGPQPGASVTSAATCGRLTANLSAALNKMRGTLTAWDPHLEP